MSRISKISQMKIIEIKTTIFFELLKLKNASMWDIFAQMIDGEEKQILFLDNDNKLLFNYILPKNIEKLHEDKKLFTEQYIQKLSEAN